MKKTKSRLIVLITSIFAILILSLFIYLKAIPALVSNEKILNFVEKIVEQNFGAKLEIVKPKLKTSIVPRIIFEIDNIEINKDGKNLLKITNLSSDFSFHKIFKKRIEVNKFGADYIYADVNELLAILPNQNQNNKQTELKSDWRISLFNSVLYIKDCLVLYNPAENFNLKLAGKDIEITETNNPKYIKFNFVVDLNKDGKKLSFKIKDDNKIFFKDKKLIVQNSEFFFNKSKMIINANMNENRYFEANVHSNGFKFEDISDLINTNLIIPNGSDLLALFKDIKGNFDMSVNINNNDINGKIKLNKLTFSMPMVNNIPITFNNALFTIADNKINISDVNGYYGKSTNNSIVATGTVNDFMKTFETNVESFVVGTKELTTDYLTPMINYPIELIGETTSKVKVKMLGEKIDIAVIFRLKKGYDILVDGMSLTPTNYERAFRADMVLIKNMLELTNLNYYIADSFTAGVVAEPLVQMFGNFDIYNNMEIHNLGFKITKPLPSEFLNVLIGQRIFRKGLIYGNLEYVANAQTPYLNGNLSMDKVFIPSQRLSINKGTFKTDEKFLKIDADGKFRRTPYNFHGSIINAMTFPIVIENTSLKLSDLDIDKILHSMARQAEREKLKKEELAKTLASEKDVIIEEEKDEPIENTEPLKFPQGLIVIKNANLEIGKGKYKELDFSNVKGTMSLTENGILEFYSNKFNIAEGTSSAKVYCDLVNPLYKIRLGIKDVNSDILATSILSLPKEISGKARGFLALETDNSFKLNGRIKFDIQNGAIAKVGLVEYLLNVVSIFRNPLAMITPATVMDVVNIPKGEFTKIAGDLEIKNNIIRKIDIKSQASQLSTYIAGRYDLEKADASIRIYTKFSNAHQGIAGFVRKISLSALANKVSMSTRNDSNYYSSELSKIPPLNVGEEHSQVFLTKVEGDVEHFNFLSSLRRIK